MNLELTYSAIFIVDLLKLTIIFTLLFGFEKRKNIRFNMFAFVIVIFCLIILLTLNNISNKIFVILPAQCAFIFLLLNTRCFTAIKLFFLTHFLVSIIDELIRAIIILTCFCSDSLIKVAELKVDCIATICSLSIIVAIAGIFKKKRKSINQVVVQFRYYTVFYYFLIIFLSGSLIAYADIAVFDEEIISRVKVLVLVATGGLSVIIIILAILMHILLIVNSNLKNENMFAQKCMTEQAQQYKVITTKNEYIKKFKHDYEEHLTVLKYISQKGDMQKIVKYINQMDESKKIISYCNTNNIIGDAIVNEYYDKCAMEGIDFKIIGKFCDSLMINETDLCVLLSNVTKNAYEAARKCIDEKLVEINIKHYKEKLIITIKNTVSKTVTLNSEILLTTKVDKEFHGIGVKNMKEIVDKYDGSIKFWMDGAYFITEIII